ncbi:MAG: hypothetical protein DRH57_08150 [Candidatus Cloacimonadota bacterium]|nr:MAG: hypothetical protein DRH57_08150 [Candidatus Cloacimonadota bacterium]
MNKIKFTTYFIYLLLISGLFVELQCTDELADKQKITNNLSPILIYDEDDLLQITRRCGKISWRCVPLSHYCV